MKIASYEQRFYRQNPGILERIGRNIRLLVWLAANLIAWFTVGRRARKAYAEAKKHGEAIILEDLIEADAE